MKTSDTTASDVDLWVLNMSTRARSLMIGEITALTWSYKKSSAEYFAVEMIGEEGGHMSLTFLTGQPDKPDRLADVESTCFPVVDMAEAKKLAKLFLTSAGAVTDVFPYVIQ
ncbi:hypothetical protein [Pseudomonas fragariae (ex Marin et al. 2024)]|uniref:hypothetical protein n=1 Tax=Pseudomonas fragariae (ex Marin et al. 2024) TaxID=3080056 RepID=UPI003F7A5CAD